MTDSERKSIQAVYDLLSIIRKENEVFKENINNQVKSVTERVDQKLLPLTLEKQVGEAINNAMTKALSESLGGYNSPLTKYATSVVEKHRAQIESIFDDVVREGIASDEFRIRVREVLLSKIAKTMISGLDGSVDKTVNLMKQDAVFRSRLTLAVNGLVEEFLKK